MVVSTSSRLRKVDARLLLPLWSPFSQYIAKLFCSPKKAHLVDAIDGVLLKVHPHISCCSDVVSDGPSVQCLQGF